MEFSCFCPGLVNGLSRQERSKTAMARKKEAEERFIKNGSIFLEKLIGCWNGRCSPIRNFSAKELQLATNNYDPVNVLDHPDEWYKGCIEGRIVSIKYYRDDIFHGAINEIVTAAQMNAHNNNLKLIGCCLETRCLFAVFEFAENGTLYNHIHPPAENGRTPPSHPILWKSRLRIATDIASVVAYLHTALRTPTIHNNISASNIFLDRDNVAKLSGFELSIAIPEGETHVEDDYEQFRNIGYLAPEILQTNLLTEKVDVFSFGVLLMELLTGQLPFDVRPPLVTRFRNHVLSKEDNQVLHPTILEEVVRINVRQQVRAVSELALRCTERNPEERPTMLDVARQLLQLKRTIVDQ